jgi:peptidoglycan/LPS O-acetylase OafA/YrhL
MDGLAAGAYLALAAREEGGLKRLVLPAASLFVLTSAFLVPITLLRLRLLTVVDSLWTVECAALLVLLVTAASHTPLAHIGRSSVLQWLGKYSYGMYVFANLLIPLLAGWLTAAGLASSLGSPLAGQLAYLAMMSAATTGSAVASWHLFEKHFLKAKPLFQ